MTVENPEIESRSILAKATNTTVEQVPDDAALESFDRWDSIAHMNLILGLEEKMGRQLETSEIISIVDLDSIKAILAR